MRHEPPIWVGIVSLITFFSETSVAATLLPFFVDEVLHANVEWVGSALTAFYVGASVGLLVSGWMADTIGLRKTLLIVSTLNAGLVNLQGWVRSPAALIAVRAAFGLTITYALGLSWVATLAPKARLARWMAASVLIAQASLMAGGFIAGTMKGSQLSLACGIISVFPALTGSCLPGFVLGSRTPC